MNDSSDGGGNERMREPISRTLCATGLCIVLIVGSACGDSGEKKAAELVSQGMTAQAAGNLDDAGADFLQATNEDSDNKYAFYNLGVVYQQQGKTVDAEFAYRIALEKDPSFSQALYNLALIRFESGSTDEAIELYRKTIVANPRFAQAYFNLGLALKSVGKLDEGNTNIKLAIELDPLLASRAQDLSTPVGSPSSGATPVATP